MKNSAWRKFKRTKSTKNKKKVHWSKQLEEVHVFDAERENDAPDDVLFSENLNSFNSIDVPENQSNFWPNTEAEMVPVNATSDQKQKLEKMSLENKVERPAWKKCFDVEDDSLGEDWVWLGWA